MAWNEPGNNDKDPWKNKGGKNQGPPDLDDLFKDLGNKFGGIFGGGSSGGGKSGKSFSSVGISIALVVAILVFTPLRKQSKVLFYVLANTQVM